MQRDDPAAAGLAPVLDEAVVIINARSGSGCPDDWPAMIEAKFGALGIRARVELVQSGDEIVAAAQAALHAGHPLVVAGGGDGTISAVASQLAGTHAVLGVLPLGTLNHFAKDLGLPLELDEAIARIGQRRVTRVDVGEVNGRVFINNSSLGLYPDIVLDRERQRRRLGRGKWTALLSATLHALRRYPVLSLRLRVDGHAIDRRSAFVFVGNNCYSMQGFEIGERGGMRDGELSLYVTQRTGRFGLVRLAFFALFGRLRQAEDFDMITARELVVTTKKRRMRVAADGEVVKMETPLTYRIRPGALRVCA